MRWEILWKFIYWSALNWAVETCSLIVIVDYVRYKRELLCLCHLAKRVIRSNPNNGRLVCKCPATPSRSLFQKTQYQRLLTHPHHLDRAEVVHRCRLGNCHLCHLGQMRTIDCQWDHFEKPHNWAFCYIPKQCCYILISVLLIGSPWAADLAYRVL